MSDQLEVKVIEAPEEDRKGVSDRGSAVYSKFAKHAKRKEEDPP
jgi:hypothetical protein